MQVCGAGRGAVAATAMPPESDTAMMHHARAGQRAAPCSGGGAGSEGGEKAPGHAAANGAADAGKCSVLVYDVDRSDLLRLTGSINLG